MAGFSVSDAALEGIRLTREKPRIVLLWGLYYIAFIVVMGVIAYLTLGPHMSDLLTRMSSPPKDPAAAERLIATVLPFLDIAGPVSLVFQAMFTAAIYRRVLRPDDGRAGLRLGMDELRQLAVIALFGLVLMGLLSILTMVDFITAGLPDNQLSVLFSALLRVAGLCAAVVLLVRLSLVGAASFAQHRLAILQGWRLSQGQVWRLLGAYLLATVLAVVVWFLMQFLLGLLFVVLHGATGLAPTGPQGGGPAAMIAFVVLEAFASLVATCAYVILLAPPAAAYAALAGEAVA